jgi:hypothetical protein
MLTGVRRCAFIVGLLCIREGGDVVDFQLGRSENEHILLLTAQ